MEREANGVSGRALGIFTLDGGCSVPRARRYVVDSTNGLTRATRAVRPNRSTCISPGGCPCGVRYTETRGRMWGLVLGGARVPGGASEQHENN
jgi:hypothetical protein